MRELLGIKKHQANRKVEEIQGSEENDKYRKVNDSLLPGERHKVSWKKRSERTKESISKK